MQNAPYIGTLTAVVRFQRSFRYVTSDTTLTKVQEASDEMLGISKERYDLTHCDRGRISIVRPSPRNYKVLFFGTQPVCVGWKVGDEEVRNNADGDGGYTFEYEYPSPTAVAAHTLHVSNSTGE